MSSRLEFSDWIVNGKSPQISEISEENPPSELALARRSLMLLYGLGRGVSEPSEIEQIPLKHSDHAARLSSALLLVLHFREYIREDRERVNEVLELAKLRISSPLAQSLLLLTAETVDDIHHSLPRQNQETRRASLLVQVALSSLALRQEKYHTALQFLLRSLELAKASRTTRFIGGVLYYNISLCLLHLNQSLPMAMAWFGEASQLGLGQNPWLWFHLAQASITVITTTQSEEQKESCGRYTERCLSRTRHLLLEDQMESIESYRHYMSQINPSTKSTQLVSHLLQMSIASDLANGCWPLAARRAQIFLELFANNIDVLMSVRVAACCIYAYCRLGQPARALSVIQPLRFDLISPSEFRTSPDVSRLMAHLCVVYAQAKQWKMMKLVISSLLPQVISTDEVKQVTNWLKAVK